MQLLGYCIYRLYCIYTVYIEYIVYIGCTYIYIYIYCVIVLLCLQSKPQYFPIFQWGFDSPQVKQDMISNIINFIYEFIHNLPDKLLNDLRLSILGN